MSGNDGQMSGNVLGDGPFTIEWLQTALQRWAQSAATVAEWSAVDIAKGVGFLSQVLRVRLDWSAATSALPASVVLKVPDETGFQLYLKNTDAVLADDELATLVPGAHACECAFYNLAMKDKIPVKVPYCYLAQPNDGGQLGVLLFEDLCDKGAVPNIVTGLNLAQMMQLAEQIAHLQAYSLTHDEWKSSSALQSTFESFGDSAWRKIVKGPIEQLKVNFSQFFGEAFIQRAVDAYGGMESVSYVYRLNDELAMPDVMVHGDFRCGNLLFDRAVDEQGKATAGEQLVAVIDWQFVHPGSAAEDLCRVMSMSCQADVRRRDGERVLRHYHATLVAQLARARRPPPFSFEQFMTAYRRAFESYGLLVAASVMGAMTTIDAVVGTGVERDRRLDILLHRIKCVLQEAYDITDSRNSVGHTV